MTLARKSFEHLYLNANSIAELALMRALDKALSTPSESTPDQLAAAEAFANAVNHPDPATFDWSALQGVYGFDGPLDAVPSVPNAGETPPPAPARVPGFDAIVGIDDDEDLDGPIDVARYLSRVYAARPSLQARIDDCFARADLAALEAALSTLPTDRPPLTSALAPDAFAHWLQLYESHHDGMQEAVLGIRRLEPLFPD